MPGHSAIIFDKMGIDTQEVIAAAGTKWNFLKFYPGLVGGHCIGVDPYYLLHKSKELGVDPQVVASGRRINDAMPAYVAKRLIQMLIQNGKSPQDCKILMMGMTFKEDVSDIRNSKVADLIKEIQAYSVKVDIIDVHASHEEVAHEYGITMSDKPADNYDAVVVSVAHKDYKSLDMDYFKSIMNNNPILFDLKAVYPKNVEGMKVWRL